MRRLVLLLCATILLSTAPIRAQTAADSEVTICTDRPAFANSRVVVPLGGLLAENGFLVTNGHGAVVPCCAPFSPKPMGRLPPVIEHPNKRVRNQTRDSSSSSIRAATVTNLITTEEDCIEICG